MTKSNNDFAIEKEYIEEVETRDVSVYLLNGIKLNGKIVAHDDRCLILEDYSRKKQLIYKHSTATIVRT